MDNYHQLNASKYAQAQSKIFNNSSFKSSTKLSSTIKSNSSNIGLMAKFQFFSQTLNNIQYQTQKLITDTNQSTDNAKKMTTQIGEKGMKQQYNKCSQQVKRFQKAFLYGKQEAQKRAQSLWSDCKLLKIKQGNVKNMINQLKFKMDRLQKTLGYYCGTENMQINTNVFF